MGPIVIGLLASLASPSAQQDASGVVSRFVGAWDTDPNLMCSKGQIEGPDTLVLADSVLESLAQGRDAADEGKNIPAAIAQSSDAVTMMTELLRVSKTSSNRYRCAELPMAAFNQPTTDPNLRLVAQNFIFTWHQQIEINDRFNAFTKQLGTLSSAEMADQMSTMQVDRDKIWHTLLAPTQIILLSLVDTKHTDERGKLYALIITSQQKADLIAKATKLFPAALTTAPDKQDMPTFIATMYLTVLNSHKASDEK